MLALLLTLLLWQQTSSSDELWARILEANLPQRTLQAGWNQIKHSPMLEEDLRSEGQVWLRQGEALRWEMQQPVRRVTLLNGTDARGRFRMPSEKDFQVTVLTADDAVTVQLVPLRRDLKQLLGRMVLDVDPKTLLVRHLMMIGTEGEWTRIEFHHVVRDAALPDALFQKE